MEILSLGEKIKKLRKEKNLTLKELAGERITAAQISHIERDKSHTSQELLDYLSQKLDVSVDYLQETKEMQARKLTDGLIMQSEIYIKYGELEKAKEEIDKIMNICKEYKLVDNYGKSNFLLATINLKEDDYNSAITNFEKSLYLFIKTNDKENIVKCYIQTGKIYIKEKFYKGSLNQFQFAEDQLKDINLEDTNIYKELYSNISYCYRKLNQNEKALEYAERIKKLEGRIDTKEETDIYVLKAHNFLETGKYEDAKEYYKKALNILHIEDNKTELANVYLTLCKVYLSLNDMDSFLEYSNKAYQMKREDEDECTINCIFNMVKAYIELKDFENAIRYIKIALSISIKIQNKLLEYKSLKYYSTIYLKGGDYDTSIEYINKCIELVSTMDDKKVLADLYIELGKIYGNTSKEKELEYYQKGVDIYKTLEII